METREKLEKQRSRTGEIGKAILAAVGIAGILVVGVTIPNALQALPLLGIGRRKYYAKSALNRLLKNGLIEFRTEEEERYLRLTKRGHTKLIMLELAHSDKKKNIRWDGKWRILIFDIKEIQKYQRDQMRASLSEIGFVKLQNSVWVYPHDSEDLLFLLKTYYGFNRNVLYIIAEKIEHDKELRKHFDLPFEF